MATHAHRRAARTGLALGCVIAAAGSGGPTASAATLSAFPEPMYAAGPGEENRILVHLPEPGLPELPSPWPSQPPPVPEGPSAFFVAQYSPSAGPADGDGAGAGCEPSARVLAGAPAPTFACPFAGVPTISVSLGDGDDMASVHGWSGGGGGVSLHAQGGTGFDDLDGGALADRLAGDDGPDYIKGYEGDDSLSGGAGERDVLLGHAGDDSLDGGAGTDRLAGGMGADSLEGGAGDDYMEGEGSIVNVGGGQPGSDRLSGGDGDDRFFSRDGVVDVVDCGGGTDTVSADSLDDVRGNCENVSGTAPSRARLRADLRSDVRLLARALARAGLGRLGRRPIRHRFTPLTAGTVVVTLTVRARRARDSISIGRGTARAATAGRLVVNVRLNRAGRRLVGRSRRLRIAIGATFRPRVGAPVSARSTFIASRRRSG